MNNLSGYDYLRKLRQKARFLKIDRTRVTAQIKAFKTQSDSLAQCVQGLLSVKAYNRASSKQSQIESIQSRIDSLEKLSFNIAHEQRVYGKAIQRLISLHNQKVKPSDWYIEQQEDQITQQLVKGLLAVPMYSMHHYEWSTQEWW